MSHDTTLVTLLTPVTARGNIHRQALQAHASDPQAAGVDGFLLTVTTGEGHLR
jgi:dihydrodipicolinate synthase/N-acetylneuraminate lyase